MQIKRKIKGGKSNGTINQREKLNDKIIGINYREKQIGKSKGKIKGVYL